MREYKPTYCIGLLSGCIEIFFACVPMLILVDLDMALSGEAKFGQFFGTFALILLLYSIVSVLFILLISFIMGLFTRRIATLSDYAVSYQGTTIPLDSIRYLTLYLPQLSKHASKPQTLTIWADKKTYMDIKHPSIALIVALKKRCHFAGFDVDDWKSRLKQTLWIQLGITVFSIIAIIFGFE